MRIATIKITPVAVPDVPLLNTKGVHGSVFLRAIIELETDTGLVGLGEAYGAKRTLAGLRAVGPALEGLDPYDLRDLRRRVEQALPEGGGVNAPTALADHKVVDVVYSAFEIACLDLRGKEVGRPLYDLLGGAVRKDIPFGGYLFFKYANLPGAVSEDIFGDVLTPDEMVAQAQDFVGQYGFKSLKLKRQMRGKLFTRGPFFGWIRGQQQSGLQEREPCGHDQIVSGQFQPQLFRLFDERQILMGQGQDRDFAQIDLLGA